MLDFLIMLPAGGRAGGSLLLLPDMRSAARWKDDQEIQQITIDLAYIVSVSQACDAAQARRGDAESVAAHLFRPAAAAD